MAPDDLSLIHGPFQAKAFLLPAAAPYGAAVADVIPRRNHRVACLVQVVSEIIKRGARVTAERTTAFFQYVNEMLVEPLLAVLAQAEVESHVSGLQVTAETAQAVSLDAQAVAQAAEAAFAAVRGWVRPDGSSRWWWCKRANGDQVESSLKNSNFSRAKKKNKVESKSKFL